MPRQDVSSRRWRRWWWVFAMLIAAPAAVLAVLGASAVRADEIARQQLQRDQQQRLAQVADAAIATALDRVVDSVGTTGSASPGNPLPLEGQTPFVLEENQVIVFPTARVFVAAPGVEPPREAAVGLTAETRGLVTQAQAAAAQRYDDAARAVYERLATSTALGDWATWQLSLLEVRGTDPATPPRKPRVPSHVPGGVSPSGVPVAILAAALVEQADGSVRGEFAGYLQRTLDDLRRGRWWLTLEQRRYYDAQLQTWLASARGGSVDLIAEDSAIAALSALASNIAQAILSGQQLRSRAVVVNNQSGRTLLIWTPPGQSARAWSGIALSTDGLVRFLTDALANLRSPARLALSDSRGTFWGDLIDERAAHFALSSVAGWTLTLGEAGDAGAARRERNRRLLNYTLIAVPIVVLGCGLAMTVSIVRRELALSRLRAEFLAAVTHEFKSPITGIRLLMERISCGHVQATDGRTRYYDAISAEVDRLDGLVNRLLEAHRVEVGRREYVFRHTQIESVASRVVLRMQPHANAKNIRLRLQSEPILPDVMVDVDSIGDAIRNLLDNAIKYSPAGTVVDLTIGSDGNTVSISVTDEGIGVDPREAARLFQPFYRGKRGDQANVHGTGLGLALVKAAADGHGGSVEVAAIEGRGSRFTLLLPVAHSNRTTANRRALTWRES